MKKIIAAVFLLSCMYANGQDGALGEGQKMQVLFNGKNLDGWYSFLSSKGKNNDVDKVFAVEKGLLHISGKEFGYICNNKVYKNFMLVVEFKWGEKKYPPRDADTSKRDNGVLFYVPAAAKDTVWPRSIECQIQEGDVGDFWLVDSTTIVIDGKRTTPMNYCRAKKKADGELPHGEWNKVVIIAHNGTITYMVNGKKVNEGREPSLSEGKIMIQSEGAEIYYRRIDIAELK
jgi:hypothetical protein